MLTAGGGGDGGGDFDLDGDGDGDWDGVDWDHVDLEGRIAGMQARVANETYNREKEVNWIAVDNLRTLNRIRAHGLWNGTVPVHEFGSRILKGTPYEAVDSTTGALVNFFVALGGSVFVGTEVSSYSHDLLATRFFRDRGSPNYRYRPENYERDDGGGGLVDWTPPGLETPPGFKC